MLDLVRLYLFVFGGFTIAGGVMGFVKAKSRASLIAGGASGALLLASGYLVGSRGTVGLVLGLVVSFALLGRFGGAFRKNRKMMPGGLMVLLGMAGVVLCGLGLGAR